ncbi:MAG: L-arabinose transport system permease protein AraP [Firmicutes bacterium ADurb.Bin419]|nr:MAG: L-arabinose transport system permease protein AraP [Firmicutes bacterium ADurb.Bin419]
MKNKLRLNIKNKEALVGYMFSMPYLIGFLIFFVIPTVISIYYCFTKGIGGVKFVGLDNFKSLLSSGSYLLAVKNTLIFNAISVPLIIIVSLFLALLLNKAFRGMRYFRMFFVMPLVIPVASIILVWQITFNEFGALNSILNRFNLNTVNWLKSEWSMAILVLLYVWKNCGYNIILFTAGINSIPKDYYEAADIDGASSFRRLIAITLPLLIPTGFFVFIISIINSFKVFREAYLLCGDYPPMNMYMLQHFMNNNFNNLNYQRLSTASLLMGLAIAALVFVLYKVEGRYGKSF